MARSGRKRPLSTQFLPLGSGAEAAGVVGSPLHLDVVWTLHSAVATGGVADAPGTARPLRLTSAWTLHIATASVTVPPPVVPVDIEALFLAAARASRKRITKVTLCDSQTLEPLEDVTALIRDGSVTADRNSVVRSTMEMSVANVKGVNTPRNLNDTFALNRVLKIERGYHIARVGPRTVSLGYFLIEKPNNQETAAGSALTVRGQDLFKRGRRAAFGEPGFYPSGMTLEAVVQDASLKMGLPPRWATSWGADYVLGQDVPYSLGDNIRDFLAQLVRDFAGEWYMDNDAYVTLGPLPTDLSTLAPSWTFEPGDMYFTQASRELDDDSLYNHVIAVGESAALNVGPYPHTPRGEARDLNPDSPYYLPVVGEGYEDLLFLYTSADITTDEQAQAVADAMLLEKEMVEEAIGIASAPLPFLKVGEVVSVTAPRSGLAGNVLLDSIIYPVVAGEQTMSGKRLRSLS